MADNFFGFDTTFSTALGKGDLDEELLTDDVEEEYDALNDETFGRAANDDWEEAHEKLSELIKNGNFQGQSDLNDFQLERDKNQEEIVSRSISQLGLEDDLDDPAIMTISRNCHSSSCLKSIFGPSPPPPAILETEICGSPKTHSIWSATPNDSGISSFLKTLSHSSSGHSKSSCPTLSPSLNSTSDSVFSPPKAWRAEELERDLLSSSSRESSNSNWPQVPQLNAENQQNLFKSSPAQFTGLNHNQNKIGPEKMLTHEEVERHLRSDPRLCLPPKVNSYSQTPLKICEPHSPQMLRPNILNASAGPTHQSSPVIPIRPRGHLMGARPDHPLLPLPYGVDPKINNMLHNQMTIRNHLPNIPPGFHPANINLNQAHLHNLPTRTIPHPFMQKQFQVTQLVPQVLYNRRFENDMYARNMPQTVEDEYAGLMTQREKEWLIRIQLLLLKVDNPYIEDYYYTTMVARKCQKKYSENALKGGGDAPEIILPETSKQENKTYVPTQFEGSLGKLQAVSVNFPRKVLDITVKRTLEDEEGRVVTNQSLTKYRRLLLDIEKLYTCLLLIDDEEKRILAKPDNEAQPHREKIERLTKDIFSGIFSDSSDENFQNIMTIRKGRNLLMRAIKIFNKAQQLQSFIVLFRNFPWVLKKDQTDQVLLQHCDIIRYVIKSCSLSDLVQLGEALGNDSLTEASCNKEKSKLVIVLKHKFGSSVICTMLKHAEELYSGYELFENEMQSRWANIVLHFVDCICSQVNSSVSPPLTPYSNLLSHFQRFVTDSDKFNVLKEKLASFDSDHKSDISNKST